MEFSPEKSIFKNSSARKQYLADVTASFEEAQGHAELICLYQEFQPTLEKMAASPEEYDAMTLEIIQARYKGFHQRIDEQDERMARLYEEHQERMLSL